MDIEHGVLDDLPELLELSEVADDGHGGPLHHYVAVGQDLEGFQSGTVGPD